MNQSPVDSKWLSFTVSASVFLFFAMMLSVPRGYTAGAVLLLLSSLYFFAKRQSLKLNGEDKILTYLLIAIFLAGLLSFMYHGNTARELDLVSRYLLAVPVLLMLTRIPVRLSWLWSGLIVGAVSGAVMVFWEVQVLGAERPMGFTGGIQLGNLGLMIGVFCAAGLFWARQQEQYSLAWQAALIIGAITGFYVSIASGARGGWIAMPIIVVLFCAPLVNKRNLKWAVAVSVLAFAGLATVAATVPYVETRYNDAVTDIREYSKGNADTSIGARFAIWHAALLMIQQKPLLGWSAKDYPIELERLVATKQADAVTLRLANTHNNYLEIWVLHGAVGLIPVLALMLAAFWFFFRRLRSSKASVCALALCGSAMCSAYGIFCMSQIMLGRNNTLLFFVISLAALWGCIRNIETRAPTTLPRTPYKAS